jgi:ubiquitin carboxyl-terminal hydrolase 8
MELNGLSGLSNLGNTCYLNSTMQILNQIHELNDYLKGITELNNINDSALTLEWMMLQQLMWKKNVVISPNRFVHQIRQLSKLKGRDEFAGFDQNDANDYFYFAIECIHNSLNLKDSKQSYQRTTEKALNQYLNEIEKKDISVISRLFTSCLMYTYLNCETKKNEFYKIEHGFTIELSIPLKMGNITLYDCFQETFKDDELNGENAWYDENENIKKNVIKKTNICYLPDILAIHLKRWNYTLQKNNKFIDIPILLDLKSFMIHEYKDQTKYELFGIINHTGIICGGHYTSYIRRNNRWFLMDDIQVTEVEESSIIQSKNYCLFYRKIK